MIWFCFVLFWLYFCSKADPIMFWEKDLYIYDIMKTIKRKRTIWVNIISNLTPSLVIIVKALRGPSVSNDVAFGSIICIRRFWKENASAMSVCCTMVGSPKFRPNIVRSFLFKKWKMIQLVKIHTLVVEIGERFLVIKSRKHLIIFGQKLEVPAIVAVYRLLLDWWDVGIDFILDRPSTSKVLLITYTIKSYPFQILLPFKIW